jgi:MscS family membrane protein
MSGALESVLKDLDVDGWVFEVFAVVLVTAILNFVAFAVLRAFTLRKSFTFWDAALIDALRRPAGALIWLLGVSFAAEIVAPHADPELFAAVEPVRAVGVIACITWFLVGFISRTQTSLRERRDPSRPGLDQTTIDAVGKLLRVTVVITSMLVALQTLGYSVSGVLAFGGIGGIALGFAARDLLANFFGGAMIYMDRPFGVGDWIRSPDRNIEGTVEEIGWRLTRIRTFDQRPLYVPNAVFPQICVENPSRMTNRRILETIGVRYDDAPKVRDIVEDVEAMLRARDDIDKERTLMVHFDKFAASSLDFFLYCFTTTCVWEEYHAVKQDVLLRVLDIVARHGAEIAFPTSTLHVPHALQLALATEDERDAIKRFANPSCPSICP